MSWSKFDTAPALASLIIPCSDESGNDLYPGISKGSDGEATTRSVHTNVYVSIYVFFVYVFFMLNKDAYIFIYIYIFPYIDLYIHLFV